MDPCCVSILSTDEKDIKYVISSNIGIDERTALLCNTFHWQR